jgi:ABC-type Fe3+ transport system substrate-binding protein
MSLQRRVLGFVLLIMVVALGVAVTACGSDDSPDSSAGGSGGSTTAAQESNPALDGIIAEANKEGALNLNWGFSTRDPRPIIDAFEQAYPKIKVTLTPSQDQPANLAKLLQEHKAGNPSSTDAFVAVPQLLWAAGPDAADALEAVKWDTFAPWAKGLATSDGVGLSIFDQFSGLTYNTTQIQESELPKTAQDVLKLKQPVASTPYAAQFNILAAPEAMGEQALMEYLQAFKPAGLIGCGDLSRVASGEFAALWISCGANIGDIFAASGAPLKTAVLQDAAVTFPWYGSVPKNSAHPNAAKLWVAWLTTPEGQKLLREHELADNRRIDASKTAEQIAGYESKGVKFTDADYGFGQANPKIYTREFTGQLIGALTKK